MAKGRAPGKCIFCGKIGVTKEHLFSDWLRELFPRSRDDSHTLTRLVSWTPRPRFERKDKQGHTGSRKVRKVCKSCNSEWISAIDDAAKKHAPALIMGQSVTITDEARRALASWFAKLAMVADAMDASTALIEQIDRDWICSTSLPPMNWQIWIGYYVGEDWRDLAMQHHSGVLHFAAIGDPEMLAGYVNAATFGMGNLLALVIGTALVNMEVNIGNANDMLRRIWPARSEPFAWPLPHKVSDDEASAIALLMREAINNPRPPTD